MDQIQLYINDQLVDLSDDSPIALTFQINNLAEVQNQQGNTSNQFKLPLTQRNRQILGFPDDMAFATNLPYQKYEAKIIQDGLEIVPYGIGELNGIEQDTANITILSGNTDFFDSIGGKLYDMGDSTSIWSNYGQNLVWQPYDHTWDINSAADSQTKTDGWIYPIIDYGYMTDDFTTSIDVHNLRPGFFIKTAIDLLLKSTGYKASGSLMGDPLYPLMIAQFSNGSFEHGADYQNQVDSRGCDVNLPSALTVKYSKAGVNVGMVVFPGVTYNPNGFYNASTGIYTSTIRNSVNITLTIPSFYFYGNYNGSYAANIDIKIIYTDPANGDVTLATTNYYLSNNPSLIRLGPYRHGYTVTPKTIVSASADLPAGGMIKAIYQFNGYSQSIFTMAAGAELVIKSANQIVLYGQTVQCERIFPDISQKDLLKDTLQRFGIICQTDNTNKTVSFNSFKDIVNNIPIARDWSNKCLNQGKQVTFQLGNYAQVNYMQYQTDENLLPLKYGWSQIRIADQTLPASATLVQSPFGPSFNRPYYGGSVAQITMIDQNSGGNDFTISVVPRILIDQKLKIGEIGKTVKFTDGINPARVINDIISTPYFYKPDAPDLGPGFGQASLMFEDLRKQYYPELEKILTQTKKVVRYILLTPRDILELDLLIPVYIQQDSAYYYINKIDAWRKGQPVKVELVKLG
ncbi:hypothetical protein [Mucilaginibacter gotjawali]|uniref:Uncharacterized protein n=2 Tax=Mucilaginibacter gotjawali TaxID=1550579 RepID=A0A839SIX4_9SPHI|nr:hypothetical protein [Mucilaginibacter gotjawali]MBB3057253.1 hypothetical protein [Mucilaginibacter gotjawali]BAU52979.1 hypothetical protein MgSA37_01146 [Mucilaginibacter gotjawali]